MAIRENVRYAVRTLRRNPGFAVTAVGTLALGIAVNTAICSVVNAVLLRPLPYADAGRIVLLWTTNPSQNAFERGTGYLNIQDWRGARSFDAMTWYRDEPVVIQEEAEPEPVDGVFVPSDYFEMLGAQPAIGRFFTKQEVERGDRLVVLGYGLWQRRYGGSRDVLGRVLRIEGQPATVVGVLPASFRPLQPSSQVWMPESSASFFDSIRTTRAVKFGWNVLARLRTGVSAEQAQAEMNGIAARLAAAYPAENRDSGVRVVGLLEQVTRQVRLALSLLWAAVGLVLLIACVNLGNLLLARAAGRQREVAVRAALGASRAQIVWQLLTESAVLSLIAAAVGFGLAAAGLRTLLALAPSSVPRLNEVTLDFRALVFTVGISAAAAVLFGLTPALRLAGRAAAPVQRSVGGGRPARRLRNVLVVTEYALAIVLLSGAGLLVRSLDAVLRVDPGFRASHVLTVEMHSPAQNDPLSPGRLQELTAALEAIPGVEAAGGISRYFQSNALRSGVIVAGAPPLDPAQWTPMNYDVIAGDYLQTLHVPLLRGRYFTGADGPSAPKVAIVNDAFVRAYLRGLDPIGREFQRAGDQTRYAIVGVIGDTRRQEITREPIAEVLWPHTQRPWGMNLAIRTTGDPAAVSAAVRQAIHTFDRTAVVKSVSTLEGQMDERIAQRRFQTELLGVFAVLALFLAAIGVYGLMHYSVNERTQEIGVRMALGARPWDVFALVLGDAARVALLGMAIGGAASLWVSRVVGSLLYGVSTYDPVTYVGAFGLLAMAALLATAAPARRAAACDPLVALRG